ncbi:MAG TPA: hypothetical protein VMT43_08410 [Acidimicrobiales bacterium]|nr:hypothetical protein [Acidimicrobiales bacterium]
MSTTPHPEPAPTSPTRRPRLTRSWLAAAGIATGLTLGTAGIAAAATGGTSSTSSSTAAPSSSSSSSSTNAAPSPGQAAPSGQNPATLGHGPGETLLTGTAAAKATAAAEAAEPGATVIRAESDAQGSAYEVHMKKADGSDVTVKLDDSFKVTATDDGFA